MKYLMYAFLQLWYLIWGVVFISSMLRNAANPWALI
jgi:hypothetical protein